ncbi:hypothetical protein EVAR_75981_1 [Eumeta japonica]|uniref:Uncharacterized protein n=1 Tax=Eumeta variegata TaxID=151549 RepID=A0A4C1UAD1_EUMVA|nr:hypothetical protein EVAR_75981_1 [Eumeta japonica]
MTKSPVIANIHNVRPERESTPSATNDSSMRGSRRRRGRRGSALRPIKYDPGNLQTRYVMRIIYETMSYVKLLVIKPLTTYRLTVGIKLCLSRTPRATARAATKWHSIVPPPPGGK